MTTRVVILGTGGNCVDLLDTLLDLNSASAATLYEPLGFLDDNPDRHHTTLAGYPVLGPLALAASLEGSRVINGIGSTRSFRAKKQLLDNLALPRDRYLTLVHPSASVSRMATLGAGTAILQNATVTSHARLGDHVIVLPNSVISHDDLIGDYSCVAGGACISGNVTVEPLCYIGSGARIREGLRIGTGALVGMGAVVTRDVPPHTTVIGCPARALV
jgi:sugar O-acyltransferase (sialic acid O-acetyltransferase NeuD family)